MVGLNRGARSVTLVRLRGRGRALREPGRDRPRHCPIAPIPGPGCGRSGSTATGAAPEPPGRRRSCRSSTAYPGIPESQSPGITEAGIFGIKEPRLGPIPTLSLGAIFRPSLGPSRCVPTFPVTLQVCSHIPCDSPGVFPVTLQV